MTNKQGLSRNIPPDIQYRIRREAYFGCVHCGIAIGEYEHIDPEYSSAKEHDPSKMTFLCPTCHAKVTRGFVSKSTVWSWKENPWGRKFGHCHDSFDIGSETFFIWLGGDKIESVEKIISIGDVCILAIKSPEERGAPFKLSALFHDSENKKILEVLDNEWKAASDSFDIICSAGKIGIRNNGKFVLKIICFPPNQIVIDTIDMLYNGFRFVGDLTSLVITRPDGKTVTTGGRLHKAIDKPSSFLSFPIKGNVTHFLGGTAMSPLTDKMPSKPITTVKIPRNSVCPCESGEKYKDCCSPLYHYSL